MRAFRKTRRRPVVVQVGSARCPIYHQIYFKVVGGRRHRYERFIVAHYRPNGESGEKIRICQSFALLKDARFEASRIATAIHNGEADVLKLTSNDRTAYLHAIDALRPLGVPLHVAVAEYLEAKRHAGPGLIAAAKEYGRRNQTGTVRKPVSDVIEEFLEAKEQDGMSLRYVQSLRSHLRRFGKHFQMPIGTMTCALIEQWLRRAKQRPRTRNNIRLSIVTLFNFAKARGYLPKHLPTEADHVAKAKDRGGEIGVLQPEQLARLFENGDEETRLYLALGAFTGLRSAELIRLEWQDLNFAREHIQVAKHKSKTATRRLVPIEPNLMQWLAPYRGKVGRVFVSEHAADRAIAAAKDAGVEWPRNALRHSYATYRLAQCQDAARVALEMGNSPQMLFSNYRELADEHDAKAWFSIAPRAAANVVQMRREANRAGR